MESNNTEALWKRTSVFIINIESAHDRRHQIETDFSALGIPVKFISAIDGRKLTQMPDFYRRKSFIWRMRREITPGETGCYLSHLKTLRTFLDSGKEFGLICEDDALPHSDLVFVLNELLKYSDKWELVRLHYDIKHSISFCKIWNDYRLVTMIQGMRSSTCYLVNRRGAELLLKKLKVMNQLYDTALFSGWINIREMAVFPPPIELSFCARESTIGYNKNTARFLWCIPARIFFKFKTRLWRYGLQYFRALRLKLTKNKT